MIKTRVRKNCTILNINEEIIIKKYNNEKFYKNELYLLPIIQKIYTESPNIILPLNIQDNELIFSYLGKTLDSILPLLDIYTCLTILYQIIYTIKTMIKYKFRHRDLHLSNILAKQTNFIYKYGDFILKSEYIVTIIDFNQSCLYNDNNAIIIKGTGKQANLRYSINDDEGKHDMSTFLVKFIQKCKHIYIRELIYSFLGEKYIKLLKDIYTISDNKNLIYTDIYSRDYRFLDSSSIKNIDFILNELQNQINLH
jgi:serine/threonine protein kinase